VQLEDDLLREARKGDLRIVGPNCVGVHCSESKLSFTLFCRTGLPRHDRFLGQSGGVTGNFLALASTRKIPLNKVVSYGNQIDLRLEDYLDYLADDKAIRLIACTLKISKTRKRFSKH